MVGRFFSGCCGSRVVVQSLLLAGVLWLSSAAAPTPSAALSFHSQGELEGICNVGSLTAHTFAPGAKKAEYVFHGQCAEGKDATVTNRHYHVKGNWDSTKKTAEEKITGTFTIGYLSAYIIFDCPEDPWLNTVTCTITGKAGNGLPYFIAANAVPTNNPLSSGFLPAAQRQALKTEWNNQPALPMTQAPVIVLPLANQVLKGPLGVPISVNHNPNYGIDLEIQWKPTKTKKNVPSFWSTQNVTLSDSKSTLGSTTKVLAVTKMGKWRVRARSVFPGAPWCDWRVWEVN